MKKIITVLLISLATGSFAQSIQVQNMVNYLRSKDYEKAKASADAAAEHESTKTTSKMWMNRGNVYKAISSDTSQKVKNLDAEADEKALDAYINCFKFDKDKIYKDEIKDNFALMASRVNRKASFYASNKEFEKSLKCYDLLESALPYDYEGNLKRSNI